jgi:hypothetical protein
VRIPALVRVLLAAGVLELSTRFEIGENRRGLPGPKQSLCEQHTRSFAQSPASAISLQDSRGIGQRLNRTGYVAGIEFHDSSERFQAVKDQPSGVWRVEARRFGALLYQVRSVAAYSPASKALSVSWCRRMMEGAAS